MKKNRLNILIAASEASPLAKTGGLGDVVGSLPAAFKKLGCNVSIIIPGYRHALDQIKTTRSFAEILPVTLGRQKITPEILESELAPGIPLYIVRCDEFFDRSGIYGNSQGEYFDNPERFIFFSRSIPVFCSAAGLNPDVIMCNDWQTGLVMPLMAEGSLPHTAGVFVVHNIGYQGLVPSEKIDLIGLPDRYYRMEGLEYYDSMSLLKAGIAYAQAVTTVSPTYANEIQTPEFGSGLDGLMRSVSNRLHGILNGVDYDEWDPETDRNIKANYSRGNITAKKICKTELLKAMGLADRLGDRPLMGMITRLADQKGCRLVAEAAEKIFDMDIGLVLIGTGEKEYHDMFVKLQARFPERFALKLDFDLDLAHRIIAGCDMFLMPSLYEPCGLTQIYGLRYGSIPIVRATGGLKDTIIDPKESRDGATGFKFKKFSASEMLMAINRAVNAFSNRKYWQTIMTNAMSKDFSWHRSAKKYLSVFEKAIAARRGNK